MGTLIGGVVAVVLASLAAYNRGRAHGYAAGIVAQGRRGQADGYRAGLAAGRTAGYAAARRELHAADPPVAVPFHKLTLEIPTALLHGARSSPLVRVAVDGAVWPHSGLVVAYDAVRSRWLFDVHLTPPSGEPRS